MDDQSGNLPNQKKWQPWIRAQKFKVTGPRELVDAARKGEIKQFTGIDAPYEEPKNPEIIVDTSSIASEENVKKIMKYIKNKNLV